MQEMGQLQQIEERVEQELATNTKVEVFRNGKWIDENEIINENE